MLEKTVVKNIRRFLDKEYPGFYFKVHGSAFQMAGIPDIVGCHKGKFIAIEVKTPKTKNNVSELQKRCIRLIKEAGGLAFVAWTVDQVKEEMEGEFKKCSKKKTTSKTRKTLKRIK